MSYTVGPALALFATPAPGRAAEELATALAGPGRWIGLRIGGELPKANPDTGEPLPLLPSPFGAVLLAHGPADETVPAIRASLDRAGDAVDRAASALLVGTEHVVQPGEGALLVAMLTRRRPNFTADAYRWRWLGEHAPFGLRIGAAGYRQLHGDADAVALPRLPPADRFDGAGMVFFRDLDHARTARATPEVARDATRDEMRFIDHAGSMLAMFRRVG